MPRTVLRFPLLLCLSVAACGSGPSAGGAGGGVRTAIDTVAGVVHVRNQGTPPAWTLVEVATIGSRGGATAGPDEFGRISGVVADADGRIYVADAVALEIRVFEEDGRYVLRMGRRGGGPGEFGALTSIGWLGDRLAALDARNARLGLLAPTGQWLGQRSYLPLSGADIRLYPAGRDELYMPYLRVDGGQSELAFVRQTPDGPADTLPHPRDPRAQATVVLCTHSGGQGISTYRASFAPRLRRVPAPGVLRAEAWSADYRIAFVTAGGDTARIVERDLPPLPVPDTAWRREEADFQAFLDLFNDESCEPDRLPKPDAVERIRAFLFDEDGRMWVERRADTGFAFDIFDAEGRLLAELPAPDRLIRSPPFVRGDRLYLVVTDELDIEYVRVFEIRTGPPASRPAARRDGASSPAPAPTASRRPTAAPPLPPAPARPPA